MNIYREAKRRYDGGPFKFPDCPKCGAKYLDVCHIMTGSGELYRCDKCGHEWPCMDDRQMAEALWVELQRVTAIANTVYVIDAGTERTYCGEHRWGNNDCPFCRADGGEL